MSHVTIRCLTPFPQGTTQNVSGRKYHFAFNARGHAVAQVAEEDAPVILSIGAGYQLYDGAEDDDNTIEVDDKPLVVALEDGEVTEEISSAFLKPTVTTFKQNATAAKADKVKAKVAAEQARLAKGGHKSAASKAKAAQKSA